MAYRGGLGDALERSICKGWTGPSRPGYCNLPENGGSLMPFTVNIQPALDQNARPEFLTPWEEDFVSGNWGGDSGIIPYGQAGGSMTGPLPTPQQIAAGMPSSGLDFSSWLQQNKSAVYIGAGALVLMAMFGGRRR